MDIQILESVGLTTNESKVYLTLLKFGTLKTGEILKEAHLNSGRIYDILEELKFKGLISESSINNVRHFSAAPPSQILDYLNKKKKEIENNEVKINSVLSELNKLKNFNKKGTKAVIYTGFKGLKTAVEEAFENVKEGDEILGMGVTQLKEKKFNEFWKNWSVKRIEKKISARHIFSEESKYFGTFKKMKYTKSKILLGITPTTVDIFGKETVLILNYEEPINCILIQDENTAQSFINFFNQLWKMAK